MAWPGVAWCAEAWPGVLRRGIVWCGVVFCGAEFLTRGDSSGMILILIFAEARSISSARGMQYRQHPQRTIEGDGLDVGSMSWFCVGLQYL